MFAIRLPWEFPRAARLEVCLRGFRWRKEKPPPDVRRGFWVKTLAMTYSRMLDAHYHRRMYVSLPSSERDRVVPYSYCHQGEGGGSPGRGEYSHFGKSAHGGAGFVRWTRHTGAHALIGWEVANSWTTLRVVGQGCFGLRSNLRLYGQATRIISTG